jgi:hypothetical protein
VESFGLWQRTVALSHGKYGKLTSVKEKIFHPGPKEIQDLFLL